MGKTFFCWLLAAGLWLLVIAYWALVRWAGVKPALTGLIKMLVVEAGFIPTRSNNL